VFAERFLLETKYWLLH